MDNSYLYSIRRNRLGSQYPRTLFIISSGRQAARSHSVKYRFKTASDFSYLTGIEAADCLLVILGQKSILLSRGEQDPLWGEDIVPHENSADDLERRSPEELNKILSEYRSEFDRIALAINRDVELDRQILNFLAYNRREARGVFYLLAICDSTLLIGRLRLTKEPFEIELLREANRRSSDVHRLLRDRDWVGRTEREVANWIESEFLLVGMDWTAYSTIVGSGPRSTVLHARPTERVIDKGDLVLVDAGGEWRGYCADITRVWPASGVFSIHQREIYSLVQQAQSEALALIAPGRLLSEIHCRATDVVRDGLVALGLDRKVVAVQLPELMPHQTSHWIGRDVHDPAPYFEDDGTETRLQVGMCFTVEPGLYFRSPGTYQGIGVRIEDNVLVTENGHENLTTAPKDRM